MFSKRRRASYLEVILGREKHAQLQAWLLVFTVLQLCPLLKCRIFFASLDQLCKPNSLAKSAKFQRCLHCKLSRPKELWCPHPFDFQTTRTKQETWLNMKFLTPPPPSRRLLSAIQRTSEQSCYSKMLFKFMTTSTWSFSSVWENVRFSPVPGASLAEGGGLPVDQLAPELVHLLLHPLHLRVEPATGTFVIIMSISFSPILNDAFPLLQFWT